MLRTETAARIVMGVVPDINIDPVLVIQLVHNFQVRKPNPARSPARPTIQTIHLVIISAGPPVPDNQNRLAPTIDPKNHDARIAPTQSHKSLWVVHL